jgi:excisionase family DNA binding protein
VSGWTVRSLIWKGDLPHVRVGRRVLVDLQDLAGWVDRAKVRGV